MFFPDFGVILFFPFKFTKPQFNLAQEHSLRIELIPLVMFSKINFQLLKHYDVQDIHYGWAYVE